jgi:hypothetical protein
MQDDYINPTTDEAVSWWSIFDYDSNSKEALQDWQECNHEISSQR